MEELAADLESRILYVFLIVESLEEELFSSKKFSKCKYIFGDLDR